MNRTLIKSCLINFLIHCGFFNFDTISILKKFSENRIAHNITSKLITVYLKQSCCTPLSTEEPSSLFTVETSSSSQRTEFDVETTRTIHINEEKFTNANNESIPVQCQPGTDYPFPEKQFGKKKRSCQASRFKNFFWLHYSKKNTQSFVYFV